jgi:hypothetical protein
VADSTTGGYSTWNTKYGRMAIASSPPTQAFACSLGIWSYSYADIQGILGCVPTVDACDQSGDHAQGLDRAHGSALT